MDKETFCQFENYLKLKDFSKTYLNPVKHFLSYCHSKNLDYTKMNFQDFTDFILFIKEKHKNSYVNVFLNSIRCFYQFLQDADRLIGSHSKEEFYKIKYLKVPKEIRYHINLEQLDKLISLTGNFNFSMSARKLKAILYFMFYTGLRKSEVVNIKRKDIDLEINRAIVRIPNKSSKERLVYFPPNVGHILKNYFLEEKENNNAFNIKYYQLEYLFKFMKKFDKNIKPHAMKHSFAQLLMQNGVDIKIAQALLGHSSLSTTELYCNPSNSTISSIYKTKIG